MGHLQMSFITKEFIQARPYFKTFSPSPWMLPIGKLGGYVKLGKSFFVAVEAVKTYKSGKPMSYTLGDVIGGRVIKIAARPVKRNVGRLHVRATQIPKKDIFRKNGMGSRGWINTPGQHQMIMVFHDANRAGPHIDIHIGRLSMVYRVKPELYSQLRYNRDGMLTENSRNLLLNHVRGEVNDGSRVPQNLDHSRSNARATWVGGDPNARSYGSGRTRQVFHESTVDVYKTGNGHPIEFYAPAINPHRGVYVHCLYPGDDKRAPILIWGARKSAPPELKDRLHLKMMDPNNMPKIEQVADMSTSTAKYDGASAYIVITDKGTTVWSPRTSVKTGEQIEYTPKLNGIARVRTDGGTIVAMGEILYRTETPIWCFWKQGEYVSSASVGGILNAHAPMPAGIKPEIRLYRVDRIGRSQTGDLPFWDNRLLQQEVALLHPNIKVVDLMTPKESLTRGFEGFVVVPEGKSINDGIKVKYWQDANDWRIDKVAFQYGERGGIAGVVYATSLESGKEFKLGPGQVGNRDLTERMLNDPDSYEGVVLKVASREGHEGRAAKVVAIHNDKGYAPI